MARQTIVRMMGLQFSLFLRVVPRSSPCVLVVVVLTQILSTKERSVLWLKGDSFLTVGVAVSSFLGGKVNL